jgi:hypothetical protein
MEILATHTLSPRFNGKTAVGILLIITSLLVILGGWMYPRIAI